MTYRCPLGKIQLHDPDPRNAEAAQREAWQEREFFTVYASDRRLNWMEEQVIRNLGKRLYGDFSKKGTQ